MSYLKRLLLLSLLLANYIGYAQTALPVPVNVRSAYAKGTRTKGGSPGKNYWQNKASYSIKVNFDPKSRNLTGTVAIDYTNNSPDTLKQIEFKLYPNLYKKGAVRNMDIADTDATDGVKIQKLSINKQEQAEKQWVIDGTNMTVKVTPIAPRHSIHFDIAYSYTLNVGSHIRTGQVDSGAFFLAYFFPRVAVYDDIDGWNLNHYLGTEEFYNDFCHFNAEITVPANYQVWATGDLKNLNKVYNNKIVKRINEAGLSDKIVRIITPVDLKAGDITTGNTWKFEADNVTDLVFATSNHYLWNATSVVVDAKTHRRTRVDAVFNPDHDSYFNVAGYAQKTVEAMSYKFIKWPYPYPHETVFDGLDQMEYPMMVNDAPNDKTDENVELTAHEIYHTMFPFYMGINETKYAWMDEGWATIAEWVMSPMIAPKITDLYAIASYEKDAGKEDDVPIMTLSTQLSTHTSYLTNSYPKPALGYLYVKDMLGDALFTKAMHYYISQWHGRHPIPYDFFNCINTGSGVNLNWFWSSWFFNSGVPDLAISKVAVQKNQYTVTITNIGSKPVPVNLTFYYQDGSSKLMHQSIAVWKNGNKTYTLNFTSTKPIHKIILGTDYDVDVNKTDNVWEMK